MDIDSRNLWSGDRSGHDAVVRRGQLNQSVRMKTGLEWRCGSGLQDSRTESCALGIVLARRWFRRARILGLAPPHSEREGAERLNLLHDSLAGEGGLGESALPLSYCYGWNRGRTQLSISSTSSRWKRFPVNRGLKHEQAYHIAAEPKASSSLAKTGSKSMLIRIIHSDEHRIRSLRQLHDVATFG
jgi:hypothetical protein